MLLSTIMSLNSNFTIEILQESYYDIIRKIRLYPAIFPVSLTGIQGVDDFDLMATLPNDSEIAVKQIVSTHGCTENTELPISGSLSALTLGDPTETNYGLANFSSLNDSHKEEPHIIRYENTFYCEDTNPAMFFLLCYPYPHPVTIVGSDPYTDKHLYDIQDMIDDGYAQSDLDVDDTLLYFIVPKALSIIHQRDDNIAYASRYENLLTSLCNMYNKNPAFIKHQKISTIGTISGGNI